MPHRTPSLLVTCRSWGRFLMTMSMQPTLVAEPTREQVRPSPPRRVVLVDDHRTFVQLLQFALGSTPSLSCVGVAYSPEDGLEVIAQHAPDVVVMDYDFPGSQYDGIQTTAAITARFPDVHVVLLTGHADGDLLHRAAAAGARALLPKDGSLPDLLNALQTIGSGVLLVHPSLLHEATTPRQVDPLSAREHDVLAMLAIGLRAQDIADQLGISKNTCRGYIKSLLCKLDAHTQLEAVANARRRGLVTDP
jgi:two-component system, NarL family, nitrate/nitrite response regulator NarL